MRFLLIHSPLVGPVTWRGVTRALEALGHEVTTPSLVPAFDGTPPLWKQQARRAVEGVPSGTWLIAHSGAGPLLPAVTAELSAPPAGLVFVDAGLPHPGRTRLEALPSQFTSHVVGLADQSGNLPPWPQWFGADALSELVDDQALLDGFIADCPPIPLSMFNEPLPALALPPVPTAYLQLSDAYRAEAATAREWEWPVLELGGHHLWPLDHPAETADAIMSLADQARAWSRPA